MKIKKNHSFLSGFLEPLAGIALDSYRGSDLLITFLDNVQVAFEKFQGKFLSLPNTSAFLPF